MFLPPPMRTRAARVEALLVVVGAVVLVIVVTWPVAREPGTLITAPFPGNDQLGYLFDFRYAAEHGVPIVRDYVQSEVAVPFGRPASAAANLTLLGTLAPAVLVTKVAGPVVAYNLVNLAGLALSGIAMYVLIRWVGLGALPAAWAGVAFVLFPYHLLAATAYVTVVGYYALPLVMLGLVAWAVHPRRASGAGLIAAVALAWLTFPYLGAMAMVMLAVGLGVTGVIHGRRDGWGPAGRRLAAIGAGVIACVAVPLGAVAAINSGGATGALSRSPQDLAVLGAELSDYLIPARTSELMTRIIGPEWYADGSIGGERLAFVGWITAIVSVMGLTLALLARRSLPPRQSALLAIAVPVLVAMVAVSLRSPYDLWGAQVTFPSRWVFEVFDFVRAPGRFVIGAMVAICALGALGLHLATRRLRGPTRHGVVGLVIALTAIEFGYGVPLPSVDPTLIGARPAAQQPTWQWLRDHPGGAVMEYPEVGNTNVWRYYMYGWTVHRHPIVNAVHGPGDAGGEFTRTVRDPRPVEVPAILAGAGVRYVVLNRWAYDALQMRLPRAMPAGFTLAAEFPDGSQIWRVDAAPSAGQVYFTPPGFDIERLQWDGRRIVNWRTVLGPAVAKVRVARAGRYRIRFIVAPTGDPGAVTIAGPEGPGRVVEVPGLREAEVLLTLPRGTSDVRVIAGGAAGPNVQMMPWVLETAS
jgi:hypothetical protein